MDTLVIEKSTRREQSFKVPVRLFSPKKQTFEEAVAECNGISVDEFIDELRKRVKERYRNAKR